MEVKNTSHDHQDLDNSLTKIDHKMDKIIVAKPLEVVQKDSVAQDSTTKCSKKVSTPSQIVEKAEKQAQDIQMADQENAESDKPLRKKSQQFVTFDDQAILKDKSQAKQNECQEQSELFQSQGREVESDQLNETKEEPETQKIGLRRQSTRTKTAKNNSEYIYYCKYKEIGSAPGSNPEISSKNGQNSGMNEVKQKRKYSKKNVDQVEIVHGSAKSQKRNSFHLGRVNQQEGQKNQNPLIREVGLYPQSCGENCDQSSIGSSNTGNLGISAADFSIGNNLQKKFNFDNSKNMTMSQADVENPDKSNSKEALTGMNNQTKAYQKKDTQINTNASATKPVPLIVNQNVQSTKTAPGEKVSTEGKTSGSAGLTSKDAAASQLVGASTTSKSQKKEQKSLTPQPAPTMQPQAALPTGEVPVYCICQSSDENFMICCDRCEEWYHFQCIGLTFEQFESLNQSDDPFYCKQESCPEKEKKLKQTRVKEEAAEKRRLKGETKARKAADKAEKADKPKKKKDSISVQQVEAENTTQVKPISKTDLVSTPLNVISSKGSRMFKDSKSNVASAVPEFLQVPKDGQKAVQKKAKADKSGKQIPSSICDSNDQTDNFQAESNIDGTSAGKKRKRDKKQDQKLTEKSILEESVREKSKKQKKDKKDVKEDKKQKVKSKNSDSDKNAKDQKKQRTVFVQPGQSNPFSMKMLPMGFPLGGGLGGLPGLGPMPPMMGGMNHPIGLGNQFANIRAHQMLQMQLANKLKNGSNQVGTKGLPNLNLFKGMQPNMVGKKRPLEPLNLLGNLISKKENTNQKKQEASSHDASSSKLSNSENHSKSDDQNENQKNEVHEEDQNSGKNAVIAQQDSPTSIIGNQEAVQSPQMTQGLSTSQSGPSGNVKNVYESENYYHMILKNNSSTKAQTQVGGDSEEAIDMENGQEKEFKFAKVDRYLENKQSEIRSSDDCYNLFKQLNILPAQDNLIELILQTEGSMEVEKFAQDLDQNTNLPEAFNNYDLTEEEKSNLKLLDGSRKLQQIIDKIQEIQNVKEQKSNSYKQGSQQSSPAISRQLYNQSPAKNI